MWETQHWFLFKTSGLYFISSNIYHMLKQLVCCHMILMKFRGRVRSKEPQFLSAPRGTKRFDALFSQEEDKNRKSLFKSLQPAGPTRNIRHSFRHLTLFAQCRWSLSAPRGSPRTCLHLFVLAHMRHTSTVLNKVVPVKFCNYLLSLCDYRDTVVAVVQTGKKEM